MPIRMESVVVPELPEIKSEIKAEDFCSVASVGAAPVTPNAGSGGDSTVPDVSQANNNNATPPITSHLDQQLHHQQQQQPDTCNWVGILQSFYYSLLLSTF